jgi:hypothetical protein
VFDPSFAPCSHSRSLNTVFALLCPDDPQRLTSLNLLVQELPNGMSMEEFTAKSLESMQQHPPPEIWEAPVLGQEGKRMCFETALGPFTLRIYQAWTIKEDKAYIVTFSSPTQMYGSFRQVAEHIIEHLKFVEPVPPIKRPIELLCLKTFDSTAHCFRIKCVSWPSSTCSLTCISDIQNPFDLADPKRVGKSGFRIRLQCHHESYRNSTSAIAS